jgi:hypothetical protein
LGHLKIFSRTTGPEKLRLHESLALFGFKFVKIMVPRGLMELGATMENLFLA